MGNEGLNIELLDVSDAEILNTPEPAPAPEPVAAEPAPAPIVEQAERVRDPVTGQFRPQAPASMPDPVEAGAPNRLATQPELAPVVPVPVAEQPRQIPLAAHLEERRRFQQEIAERDQRLNEIQQRLTKLEPVAPTPDFIEDPKAYIDAKSEQTHKEVEALKAEAERLQNEQQFVRFTRELGAQETAFVAQNADYYEAINHVRRIRSDTLLDLYPQATAEQINDAIRQEELAAAAQLTQMGRNPAEGYYKLAKMTYGYKPKAATATPPAMPAVPKAPVGDPGSTLGSSGGTPSDEVGVDDLAEDDLLPLKEALAERFGNRR